MLRTDFPKETKRTIRQLREAEFRWPTDDDRSHPYPSILLSPRATAFLVRLTLCFLTQLSQFSLKLIERGEADE